MGTARGRVKHGTLHGIRRGGGGTTESDVRNPGRVLMVKDSGLRSTGYLPLSLSIYAETIFYFFFLSRVNRYLSSVLLFYIVFQKCNQIHLTR